MERKAFARACRFLNFNPLAKWSALAAAVGSGILYVALLMVLGLFVDLAVNRGRIPGYGDLASFQREKFEETWNETLSREDRKQLLENIGLDGRIADDFAAVPTGPAEPKVRALCWRARVHDILQERVGPTAAALALPEFKDLPPSAQEAFQTQATAAGAWDKSKTADLLWREHLLRLLKERDGEETAEAFRYDRMEARGGEAEFAEHELSDRGILSLVVRTQGKLYGPLIGWLARGCPWMWQWGSAAHPNFQYYLTGLLVMGVALAFLRVLLMYVLNTAAARASIEASNRLRRAVYHHTYRLGRLAFRSLGPGEAVGVFTRHLETVHNGLYAWMTIFFREPVKFGLLLAFALAVNFWLSLAFLVFALLVWLVGGQVAIYFRRQERDAARQAADQLALLQESLMMMRLVKCYLMELFNQSRVERQLSRYGRAQERRYRGQASDWPLLIFLGSVSAAVLCFMAGLIVFSGRLEAAAAVTLAAALTSLYSPLVNWLENRRLVRKARESAVVLFRFLDRPGEVGQAAGAESLRPMSKILEFRNVSLQEPGTGRKLLQSATFAIPAGQRVGLVGPDELQKHALVYLIPRFLDPSAGEIRIDGHDIRWVTLDSLRSQIGMVLQHNLVFNDTVANNISCGAPGFTLPRIVEAAKLAHAHRFIQKLPLGYETVIGEMGHFLSIHEQFRVAVARAVLRDPAILIVEEPPTPLDDDAKAMLDDTLAQILPGRTVIFLPHRISTIRSCDRVLFLHEGRIEAAGEHRELLAQNDLYKHLHYMEFNEFAEVVSSQ